MLKYEQDVSCSNQQVNISIIGKKKKKKRDKRMK